MSPAPNAAYPPITISSAVICFLPIDYAEMLTNAIYTASTETVPVHWRELAKPKLTKTVFQFDGAGAASANPYVFLGF